MDTLHQVTEVVGQFPGQKRGGECLRGTACRAHRHDDDEVIYILDGEAMVQVGDDLELVGAGDMAMIPRDVLHAIWPAQVGHTFHAFSFAVNFAGECQVANPLSAELESLVRQEIQR